MFISIYIVVVLLTTYRKMLFYGGARAVPHRRATAYFHILRLGFGKGLDKRFRWSHGCQIPSNKAVSIIIVSTNNVLRRVNVGFDYQSSVFTTRWYSITAPASAMGQSWMTPGRWVAAANPWSSSWERSSNWLSGREWSSPCGQVKYLNSPARSRY